jgi:hypothetical protein
MCRVKDASTKDAGGPEITPAMIDAGVQAIMDFFPAAWGSERHGISQGEAKAVLTNALSSMGLRHPIS